MSDQASPPELVYRLHRGTLPDPQSIPHWDDLEEWVREALIFCTGAAAIFSSQKSLDVLRKDKMLSDQHSR